MEAVACAVGRLCDDGPWVGFAPTLDDGYELVVAPVGDGTPSGARRLPAEPRDLLALAIAWFEESLPEPPEHLEATLGDIGSLVRHAAARVDDPALRRAYDDAVDAIDDGLAADVVIDRLVTAFGPDGDPLEHLRRRAGEARSAS